MIDALQVRVLNMEGALAEILTLQMLRQAGDIDAEIENSLEAVAHFNSTTPNHLHRKCHQLVQQFSDELASISQSCLQRSAPIQVLEVFCRPQSELTKQVNNLGFRACRHGFQEGDLATARVVHQTSPGTTQKFVVQPHMWSVVCLERHECRSDRSRI